MGMTTRDDRWLYLAMLMTAIFMVVFVLGVL